DLVNDQRDGTASVTAGSGGIDLVQSSHDVQQNGPVTPSAGSFLGGDPLLAPLADYGGSTPTLALLPRSPALDAGTASGAPRLDARGQRRSDGDNNGTTLPDLGAFEVQGYVVTTGADSGDGSLRAAVATNNQFGGGGVIFFSTTDMGGNAVTLET